jgi:L-ascorbate metabolism protein UlaG (beta-lactamase superfamily)
MSIEKIRPRFKKWAARVRTETQVRVLNPGQSFCFVGGSMSNQPSLLSKLHWLGHDSFRLDGPPVIYFDPWKLPAGSPTADLILVSHEHYDHCSPDDVKKISSPQTVVVADRGAAAKLAGACAMCAGDKITVGAVTIEAVPAYNPNKKFHPKSAGHLGYIVTVSGERIYFAGDTDHIPEMKAIRCDIALLPVSGTYVMTADEAVAAFNSIQPTVAVPMHYDDPDVAGTKADAQHFKDKVGERVVILKREA